MPDVEDLLARVQDLERRLSDTEAVESIQRLKAQYGRLADSRYGRGGVVDRGELERLAAELSALFSEDAIWDGGKALGVAQGRAAIYQRFLEPTLQFSWHFFVKPEIRVDGDRARGRWDILAPCTAQDGRALWMVGYEDDEYVRVDGEWLHGAMKLSVVFMAPYERGWSKAAPPTRD